MTAALAGISVLLAFAAARELAGTERAPALAARTRARLGRALGLGSADELSLRLGVAGRLARAGLAGRVSAQTFLLAKAATTGIGALLAFGALPAAPGRLVPPLAAGLLAAGFLAPDALAERLARERRRRIVAALPDALDLIAVGAAAGRSPALLLDEIAHRGSGPLAAELATALAEVECGASLAHALRSLRTRVPGPELGALAAALERSRRHGSPLADQLHELAASLRRDARRRVEERAARAAPKIQLVVAMVLVPSVLLVIAAALIANSDVLFAGL